MGPFLWKPTTKLWSHLRDAEIHPRTCNMMQPKEYISDANWGELASSSSSEILKFSGAVHRTLLVIYDVPLSSEQRMRIPWSVTIASPFSSMRILFWVPSINSSVKESWAILTPVRSPWTILLECTTFGVSIAWKQSWSHTVLKSWSNVVELQQPILTYAPDHRVITHNLQLSNDGEILRIASEKHSKGASVHPWGDYGRQWTKSLRYSQ